MARKPRNFDRQIAFRRARDRVAKDIAAAVLRAFRKGWRMLYPSIRNLRKANDMSDVWSEWESMFDSELERALALGIEVLADVDQSYYTAKGYHITYDPNWILHHHKTGKDITKISQDTHDEVEKKINAWWRTDLGMSSLVKDLQGLFGEQRATLIGINEATTLSSTVTEEMMRSAGLDQWTWYTLLDEWVCEEICRPLHGVTFTLRDPMPPDGSHIGCRCQSAPVVPGMDEPLEEMLKWAEDVPRDDHGRWTGGGGAAVVPNNQEVGRTAAGHPVYAVTNATNLLKDYSVVSVKVVDKHAGLVLASRYNMPHQAMIDAGDPLAPTEDDYVRLSVIDNNHLEADVSFAGVAFSWRDEDHDQNITDAVNNIYRATSHLANMGLPGDTPVRIFDGNHAFVVAAKMTKIEFTKAGWEDVARDEHGRWVGGAAGNKETLGPRALMQRLIKPHGGFTYQPVTHRSPKDGLMVGCYPDRGEVYQPGHVNSQTVKDYINKNMDLLRDPKNHVGGWHDDQEGHDQLCLDISRVFQTDQEAAHACVQFKQEKYFNLRTFEETYVGARGEVEAKLAKKSKPVLFLLPSQPTDAEIDEFVKKLLE